MQLQATGHEVALLAILDTSVDGYFRLLPWVLPWARRIGSLKLVKAMTLARAGNIAEIRRLTKNVLLRQWVKHVRARRRPSTPEEQRSDQIWAAIWDAVHCYRQSARFAGEIEFFRAEVQIRFQEDAALRWDRRSERVRVQDVPGNHHSYLLQPATRQRLTEAIERALARAG